MTVRAVGQTLAEERLAEERERQVWQKLAGVTDPELDEPVTEMGFVTSVELCSGGDVQVQFRLPTYWCAPNFAFMMAEDMRAAVLELPWVTSATITLYEHLSVAEINRGVNAGLPFDVAFGDQATGNLDELRRTFLGKAFQWRQEALLTRLTREGLAADDVLAWSVDELVTRAPAGSEADALVARYLDRRSVAGRFDGSSLAFVAVDGSAIEAATLGSYLRSIRRLRTNAEFNGALCRGLLVERFRLDPLPPRRDAYIMPCAATA